MKYSRQRELILKTLKENCIHPTAEQLYELIRREEPTVSLATVYRNLNLLAENGMVKKIDIAPDLAQDVESRTGFRIASYDVSFRGTCKSCQKFN